jgi:hypothetical protein
MVSEVWAILIWNLRCPWGVWLGFGGLWWFSWLSSLLLCCMGCCGRSSWCSGSGKASSIVRRLFLGSTEIVGLRIVVRLLRGIARLLWLTSNGLWSSSGLNSLNGGSFNAFRPIFQVGHQFLELLPNVCQLHCSDRVMAAERETYLQWYSE